jgi:hypothetical protein
MLETSVANLAKRDLPAQALLLAAPRLRTPEVVAAGEFHSPWQAEACPTSDRRLSLLYYYPSIFFARRDDLAQQTTEIKR